MENEGIIKLKISSPEKVIVDKGVRSVLVPATQGPLLVMHGRAPYISSLDVGVIEINRMNGEKQIIFAEAGMVEVKNNVCTILTEHAVEISKEQRVDYASNLLAYKAELKEAKSDSEKELISNHIQYIEALLRAFDKL